MGATLALISASKQKKRLGCPAKEMYDSDLFRKAYRYCVKNYDYVAVLSAKYGLLLPDEHIEPYDSSVESMTKAEQMEWTQRVSGQMRKKLPMNEISQVFFHSGSTYRRLLIRLFENQGIQCLVPIQGLRLGQRLAWYLKQESGPAPDASGMAA